MESWSLLELNQCIRQRLKDAIQGLFWVVAEINELNVNSAGHCFMELVEKAPQSGQITAKARANIWAYQFRMLSPYFETMTGQRLAAGLKVMLQASVEFHEMYGLSLQVTDINPAFTVGDLVVQRQAVIQQLKDDGVFDMNRELEFPPVPQRIAVISSETAAGYGDFVDQLHHNPHGYAFRHTLFPAIMQGNDAEESIIRALEQVFEREDEFDVVALMRGGGSQSDLNCFNSYQLAACIAQFPLPVITGIGHDRDETVADLVACISMKTPTAVAEFIIQQAMSLDNLLQELATQLTDAAELAIRRPAERLQHLSQRLQNIMHTYIRVQDREIHVLQIKFSNAVQALLLKRRNQITWLEGKLQLLDPVNLLRRGYSITLTGGKVVRNAQMLEKGQRMETILLDGKVESVVV
jgi:exodeoxyribonuclease VII large subunit